MYEKILSLLYNDLLNIIGVTITIIAFLYTIISNIRRANNKNRNKYLTYNIEDSKTIAHVPRVEFLYEGEKLYSLCERKIQINNQGISDIVKDDFSDSQKLKIIISSPEKFISYKMNFLYNGKVELIDNNIILDIDYLKRKDEFTISLFSREEIKYRVDGNITNGKIDNKSKKIFSGWKWSIVFGTMLLLYLYKFILTKLNVNLANSSTVFDIILIAIFFLLTIKNFYKEELADIFKANKELKKLKRDK
ncbi:MAG: hypothetical protein AB1Z23_09170 [Eubacteriales bacterium]